MVLIKSAGLVESERQARELSAIELIGQGLITVPLSERQQRTYDDAVRYAAEIDAREREHYEQLPARIQAENQRVMEQLNAGRLYLTNHPSDAGTPMVHFASCASVRHQADRDIAPQYDLESDGELRGSWHGGHGHEPIAKWPNLMTLDEVERLPAYRACQNCNPDTKERRKSRIPAIRPSKLSSISVDRIGRRYETTNGEHLGELTSYTVTADTIELQLTDGNFTGTRDSLVVLLPR